MAGTFGVYAFPQAAPYEQLRQLAQRAESIGFDSIWVADQTPMAFPGLIELEAWSVLGALARDTTRIRLGTLVTPANLRHPLITAMAATTVDHASAGRLTLGMGAGGTPADLEGIGQGSISNAELLDRLEEQLDTIDRLLRGETVTRTEGYYLTKNAVVPRPVQKPRLPILVAAQGPKSIRIAAKRADTWNAIGTPVASDSKTRSEALAITRHQIELLEEACGAIGRDPATVQRSVLAWPASAPESESSLADWIGQHRELGFEECIFPPTGEPEPDAVLERFVSDQRGASIG